jgi:hypothetical protein
MACKQEYDMIGAWQSLYLLVEILRSGEISHSRVDAPSKV